MNADSNVDKDAVPTCETRELEVRIDRIDRHQALTNCFARGEQSDQSRFRNHNTIGRLRLRGVLDRAALRAAFEKGVGHIFSLTEERVADYSAVDRIIAEEALVSVDLPGGAVIRGRLLRLSELEFVLLITENQRAASCLPMHSLICQLVAFYSAIAHQEAGAHGGNYKDCPTKEQPQPGPATLQRQFECWVRHLSGAPETLQLPTEIERPATPYYSCGRVNLKLSAGLTRCLREFAELRQVGLFELLVSSWAVLLGRWSSQDDFVIGTCATSRSRLDAPLGQSFKNIVPVRVLLKQNLPIEDLLRRVDLAMKEAAAHAYVPLQRMVEAVGAVRDGGTLFQVQMMFNEMPTESIDDTELRLPMLTIDEVSVESETTGVELSLSLNGGDDGLTGTLEYAKELFEYETVERMMYGWESLLKGILKDSQQPTSLLPVMGAAERELVLYGLNRQAAYYPDDRLIHELFEEQVRRAPESIAIVYEDESITFTELNSRANRCARYLRERGVGLEELVAVWMNRSAQMVVALLGILKAGGAYVPLDPGLPAERLGYILKDAAPRILLTQRHLRGCLPLVSSEIEVIEIDGRWSAIADRDDTDLGRGSVGCTERSLAYVIYTSGSTGVPKGAMNEHRGMVNRIVSAQRSIEQFSQEDVCCQKTSISFADATVEVFGALCNGLRLVIIPDSVMRDGTGIAALIAKERVTRLITVTSLARSMLESAQAMRDLAGLRSWNLGGEAVPADLLLKLQRQLPGCEFLNVYGQSEASCDATYYKSRFFEGKRVPIGRPLPGVQIYILDQYGEPVPIGVTGEIHVGGVCVGRGYLKRPELTAERFLPDNFNKQGTGQLYKTGDLGRWRADGNIEYLGRSDHQVKIRGFRIEPEEIEAQLLQHGQVRQAVVVARDDPDGQKCLIAYITLRDEGDEHGAAALSIKRLRAHLTEALPEYMVPAAIVVLSELPMTPNGKVDRRVLPQPGTEAYSTAPYEAPQGEIEQMLAGMWRHLLQVERVGRKDNFFELGGHSLIASRLIARVNQSFDINLPPSVGYRNPTIETLASCILKYLPRS